MQVASITSIIHKLTLLFTHHAYILPKHALNLPTFFKVMRYDMCKCKDMCKFKAILPI